MVNGNSHEERQREARRRRAQLRRSRQAIHDAAGDIAVVAGDMGELLEVTGQVARLALARPELGSKGAIIIRVLAQHREVTGQRAMKRNACFICVFKIEALGEYLVDNDGNPPAGIELATWNWSMERIREMATVTDTDRVMASLNPFLPALVATPAGQVDGMVANIVATHMRNESRGPSNYNPLDWHCMIHTVGLMMHEEVDEAREAAQANADAGNNNPAINIAPQA
jgi:hypothetical protein